MQDMTQPPSLQPQCSLVKLNPFMGRNSIEALGIFVSFFILQIKREMSQQGVMQLMSSKDT